MRAVNLIPADQRRAQGAAGKSGGGVYGLLGVLALVVVALAASTIMSRHVADREAQADRLEAQAQAAKAKAGALASYKQFNELVKSRSAQVQALAATRFDWGSSLQQVSRVIPSDVALTQLAATTAPGAGPGGSVSLRSALENPAIELIGCAPSQSRVALLMARLRRLEGVERVSVASSGKTEQTASAPAESGVSEDSGAQGCQTSDQVPQFQIVVFFGAEQAVTATTGATPGTVKAAVETLNGANPTTTTPAPATPGS
jgi:Tfp pilus assembly protein PilN